MIYWIDSRKGLIVAIASVNKEVWLSVRELPGLNELLYVCHGNSYQKFKCQGGSPNSSGGWEWRWMWTEAELKRAGELLDDDEEQEEDYEEDQGEEKKKCWLTICESQEWIGVFFFILHLEQLINFWILCNIWYFSICSAHLIIV